MRKHCWYITAIVTVPVTITVIANDEQDALTRLHDGAWHGVDPIKRDWSEAKITHTATITEGPGTNL